MKDEKTILQFRDLINGLNKKLLDSNLTEDLGSIQFHVDLYSHFKD